MAQLEKIPSAERKGFPGRNGRSLVSLLQEVQEQYNYLPEDVLRDLAREQNISLMEIYRVATFYKSFSLVPRGRHRVIACSGTACHVRGGEKTVEEISRALGVKPGCTTVDGAYSLETVNCLGACALAPLVVVDGEYHGNMSASRAASYFKQMLGKMQGQTPSDLDLDIKKKAESGCSCARLLAGENIN